MNILKTIGVIITASVFMLGATNEGCVREESSVSSTGVGRATANIQTGIDGLTVEQRNVKSRLEIDNLPGSIKHLYVISAYSGQVLLYSTVDGKVTSSAKRLTPTSLTGSGQYGGDYMVFAANGYLYRTAEVIQDDGTYGSSTPYVYWFDTQGNYHQHYITGGQIFHVSDEPLAVKDVVIRIGAEEE